MKIVKSPTEKANFNPISITFTVESEAERNAMFIMAGYDVSIPNMVERNFYCTPEDARTVQGFLRTIRTQLESGK